VKQEQQAIDAQFEKKLKGAEVAQKMSVYLVLMPSCMRQSSYSQRSINANEQIPIEAPSSQRRTPGGSLRRRPQFSPISI
jgi:hypothetical protein